MPLRLVIRKIDGRGRIVIHAEWRKKCDAEPRSSFEVVGSPWKSSREKRQALLRSSIELSLMWKQIFQTGTRSAGTCGRSRIRITSSTRKSSAQADDRSCTTKMRSPEAPATY